jgi:hypothetical protein
MKDLLSETLSTAISANLFRIINNKLDHRLYQLDYAQLLKESSRKARKI